MPLPDQPTDQPVEQPGLLERVARAWLERRNSQSGVTAMRTAAATEGRAATSATEETALRALQLKKAQHELDIAPEQEAQQKAVREATVRNLDEPNRNPAQLQTPHISTDEAGNQTAVRQNPDGSYTITPLGKLGQRPSDIRPDANGGAGATGTYSLVVDGQGRIIGSFNNKSNRLGALATGEGGGPPKPGAPPAPVPGEPVKVGGTEARKSALPATMLQTAGMATTVKDNIAKMNALADEGVVNGPIAGTLSKASQSVFGPHGPEGDFDFYGNAAVDLVYLKSGKQINEGEMKILRQMIPNRARGNVKQQVKLFSEYANGLLSKYGIDDEPQTPGAASPAAAPGAADTQVHFVRDPATSKLVRQ